MAAWGKQTRGNKGAERPFIEANPLKHRHFSGGKVYIWPEGLLRFYVQKHDEGRSEKTLNYREGKYSRTTLNKERQGEEAELGSQRQTCVELSGALMEFPGCQRAICSCPTRLMSRLSRLNQTCQPPELSSGLFTSFYRDVEHPFYSLHTPKQKGKRKSSN